MSDAHAITAPGYTWALSANHQLSFHLPDNRGALWRSPSPLLLCPVVAGVTPVLDQLVVTHLPGRGPGGRDCTLRCPLAGAQSGWVENTLYGDDHRLVVRAQYSLAGPHALQRWDVLPAGAELVVDALQAYMGQHPQPGDGRVFTPAAADFSSASYNWTYCTISPRVLLRRGPLALVLGGTTLHHDYGLVGRVREGQVEALYFDYGTTENPHPMAGGGPHAGPRLQLLVANTRDDHQAHAAFTSAMIADGIVAPKRYRPEDAAWFRPWYCTWGDQVWLAGDHFRQNVSNGRDYAHIKAVLTTDWLLAAARRIRAEGLDIGTFIIDDGWQDTRGDWNLVTERIPDMRAVVDELHALDFKVVLWWAPFDLEPSARNLSDPALVSGPSRADTTIFDYSKPGAQAWLTAKLQLWFGSEPGNWHLDGLKIDFFMQKLAPGALRGDPAWRGEEQAFVRLYQRIMAVAGRYTQSPAILCGPWNPHLLPSLTTVFLEERFDTECGNLYAKAAIRDAFLPGLRVTPHFVYYPAGNADYLWMAHYLGAIPQIGVLQAPAMTPALLAETRRELHA